ncbi:type III-A CRISPR-associated protein Csm2 [Pectinatus brassicae]|uniref:CRISPR system Cms protein Csm2 n=1 Tax=Pectinatus brassicae TaxID=862415 RepID=A0A840UIR3_9FIRM|nr:type III-A CRISPR-associated protein Csm2 [Pectinatus brassicae]MBB5335487.1 CRISPR-associated protein Csm2 [Pectinatus brassicae]
MAQSILDEAKQFFDKAMEMRKDRPIPALNTSKLRNFLNEVVTISNRVESLKAKRIQDNDDSNDLPQDLQNLVDFLDVKLMYQVGREENKWPRPLKKFYEAGNMAERINSAKQGIREYKRFADLMEAVVALHKYHGGSDK